MKTNAKIRFLTPKKQSNIICLRCLIHFFVKLFQLLIRCSHLCQWFTTKLNVSNELLIDFFQLRDFLRLYVKPTKLQNCWCKISCKEMPMQTGYFGSFLLLKKRFLQDLLQIIFFILDTFYVIVISAFNLLWFKQQKSITTFVCFHEWISIKYSEVVVIF